MQKTKKLFPIGIAVILLVSMLAMMPAPASAGDITINDGSENYPTIQAAINAANAAGGGTVLVAPGTYDESITMKPLVTIQGSGPDVTTIDGNGSDTTIIGANDSTISGFTITGGLWYGISNEYSSPTITNNFITGSVSGILNFMASPIITNNIITGNDYGISNVTASPIITNNTITGNDYGIYNDWVSMPTITNNIITNNVVYGIFNLKSSPTIDYNYVYGNTILNYHGCDAGAHDIVTPQDPHPLFVDYGFTGGTISAVTYDQISGLSVISFEEDYSDDELIGKLINPDTGQNHQFYIVGNDTSRITVVGDITDIAESGDIYAIYDYHLQPDSPCIDSGDPDSEDFVGFPDTDLDGNPRIVDGDGNGTAIVDMGAFEYRVSANQPPVADAAGPYLETTSAVLVDIDPDTLNLKSQGRWITAYLADAIVEVTLDGSGSSDPNGDPITYNLTIKDTDGYIVEISGESSPTVTLTVGEYTVELEVNDGTVNTEAPLTTITIQAVDLATVDPIDVLLNGEVCGEWGEMQDAELMVKFDRSDVQDILEARRLSENSLGPPEKNLKVFSDMLVSKS